MHITYDLQGVLHVFQHAVQVNLLDQLGEWHQITVPIPPSRMGLMVVKALESLKSALSELEDKDAEAKRVVQHEVVKKVERSAIPRRQVSAQAG